MNVDRFFVVLYRVLPCGTTYNPNGRRQNPTQKSYLVELPFERRIFILFTRSPVAPLSGGDGRPRILVRAMLVDSPRGFLGASEAKWIDGSTVKWIDQSIHVSVDRSIYPRFGGYMRSHLSWGGVDHVLCFTVRIPT